jgi:pimeloyl-ACP methyl ester carboxylesterase
MPYSNNQGVRIHYELEGEGSALVLLHGLSEDLDWWRDYGYVESLKNDYKLILIDARGHGASDKPHNPDAYKLELFVNDIVCVLDDLRIGKAHFLGFSMGGWIGFGIGKYGPERFYSLIIGAMSPYKDPAKDDTREYFKKGKDFVWADLEKRYGPKIMTPMIKVRWMANDFEALIAIASSEDWLNSVEDILPTITLPCLLFVGEADPFFPGVKKCVTSMPHATFVSFPDLLHVETLYRSDLVIPHIKRFLATVRQK